MIIQNEILDKFLSKHYKNIKKLKFNIYSAVTKSNNHVILKISPKIKKNYIKIFKLNNKNIIKIFKFRKVKSFDIIEMEQFSGKPLRTNQILINKKKFIKNVVEIIYFLIENNLVHCDIRPLNILLNEKSLKIIDFDYCTKPNTKFRMEGSIYIAPEIKRGKVHRYSDLYSVGIIISLILLKNKFPSSNNGHKTNSEIIKEMLAIEIKDDPITKITNKFLNINSEDRYLPYSQVIKFVDKSKII